MRPCDLSARELDQKVPPEASWHRDYAKSAWIHITNLPYRMTEGDLLVMFSQFGEPDFIALNRTSRGDSRGRAVLRFEDPRSAVLAVDNIDGVEILHRRVGVDHLQSDSNLIPQDLDRDSRYKVPTGEAKDTLY